MSSYHIIGVGGLARSGKDTFVSYAKRILINSGYYPFRVAFADSLKDDISSFIKQKYDIDIYTATPKEKELVRPLLVAHGCCKRNQNPSHWIELADIQINTHIREMYNCISNDKVVFLISDVRFVNEVDWVHQNNGWFVHIRKYKIGFDNGKFVGEGFIEFDKAPNEEEAKNDPLISIKADYHLDWASVDNIDTLKPFVKECLSKCPFLEIK